MTQTNEQIQELQALYANIEKQAHTLRGNPREYSVITGLCPVNAIEMLAQKIQALLSEKEADKALIAEQKFQALAYAGYAPSIPAAVPEEMTFKRAYVECQDWLNAKFYTIGWNACRAAMLKKE